MIFEPIAPLSRLDAAAPARAANAPAADGAAFTAALEAVERPVAAKGPQNPAADDGEQFEGFVLRTFVEAMLPRDDSTFGSGTAGGIWRSMMAERLGEELARNGGVGIAALLRDPAPAPAAVPPTAGKR